MTTDRRTALAAIAVGDLFHATTPNGASLICRALEVSAATIRARTVTSQYALEFDRATGAATPEIHGERVPCTVDSVAHIRLSGVGIPAPRRTFPPHQNGNPSRR